MKNVPILIPQGDAEGLRRQITQQVNKLKTQVANSSQRKEPMDLGHNRISSVADPGAPTDAVNLRTLKKQIQEVSAQHVSRKNANLYGIVFTNAGTVVAGQISPAYIVLPQRAGTPITVAVYAEVAPTGTFVFNIARNGTNILAANGTLLPTKTGPVFVANFNSNAKFNVGDVITPVVATAGSAGFVTIEVEVQPT